MANERTGGDERKPDNVETSQGGVGRLALGQ